MSETGIFVRVWGIPTLLAGFTIAGLVPAIIGTGVWHVLAWISLLIPICVMIRYGRKFFKK